MHGKACGPTHLRRLGGLGRVPAATARCVVARVQAVAAPPSCVWPLQTCGDNKEAVLCKHIRDGHNASVTSVLVLRDGADTKQVITASLDKTVASWTVNGCSNGLADPGVEVTRVSPPGAPVFSLLPVPEHKEDASTKGTAHEAGIFCGTAAKDILNWQPGKDAVNEKVRMNGHTGWVRSLAMSGKYMFSCGCNYLRQWDASWVVPKEVRKAKLFTGDILSIAVGGGKVFTGGADGSLRSWLLSKSGDLQDSVSREKAHSERVTDVVFHKNMLLSVSYDGSIKAWDASSLELVLEVKGAHDGQRIHCATIGPDNLLYTGGDDKLVRRWDPLVLAPRPSLALHQSSVRVLAAGTRDCLVSGDANGEIALWLV